MNPRRVWALLSVLAAFAPAGQADDYLKSLEQEAQGLEVDPGTREDQQRPETDLVIPTWAIERKGIDPELPPGLKREAFEKVLREHYLGTDVFYRRLSESRKAEVYRAYRAGAGIEVLRKLIMELHRRH